MTIRVLLADDDPIVRAALRAILTSAPDIEVVAEAEDGESAVAAVRSLRPDVVLMDVRMPVGDGITATEKITERTDAPRVIMLTTFDSDDALYGSLRAGASGFLLKRTSFEDIVGAVRTVHAGDALLSPRSPAACSTRSSTARRGRLAYARLDVLTNREREVLDPRRPWRVEPGDRRGHVPGRADRQDPREAGLHEARPPRSRAGGRGRVRDGAGGAGGTLAPRRAR